MKNTASLNIVLVVSGVIILAATLAVKSLLAAAQEYKTGEYVLYDTTGYEGPAVVLRPNCTTGFKFNELNIHEGQTKPDGTPTTVFSAYYECGGYNADAHVMNTSIQMDWEKEFWTHWPMPVIIGLPEENVPTLMIQYWDENRKSFDFTN